MVVHWPLCLTHLKAELSPEDFLTWIKPLQVEAAPDPDGLILYAPNAFVAEIVRERHLARIIELLGQASGQAAVRVDLEVGGPVPVQDTGRKRSPKGSRQRREHFESQLAPGYTFDNFVEGKSNEVARSAAWQVAQNPGQSNYNPLLLYGSTSLGKTHLMHAAGNLMRSLWPEMRVLYLRSEQFFSAMMRALQDKSMDQFKRRFRDVDALLLDDIQFFAGKNSTQEEFFHTFNALFDGKQQMILTCDRYPKEVDKLEPRLKSRLGWGLATQIDPPDFETRAAILLSKARERGISLPEEVAYLMAEKLKSHVRDLEGALNSLSAQSHFRGQPITVPFARETLRDLLRVHKQATSIATIQKVVADYYQLRLADLLSKRRTRSIARPRQMAMALAKELTNHSLTEIGDGFGGRDHTTVMHAERKIRELLDTDGLLREDWDKLMRKLTE